MKRSTDRIITSHAGSLYGTPALLDLMKGQRPGTAPGADHAALVKQAVSDVVAPLSGAAKGLALIRPLMAKDGLLSAAEQQQVLAALKEVYEVTEELEPAQVFDFSYLEQAARGLDASGWRAR